MRQNYTIIRCQTTDKFKVMDLLCDADEYALSGNHVDVVYYNGDNPLEMMDTQQLVEENIKKLMKNNILAESHPEYLDDWFFIKKL